MTFDLEKARDAAKFDDRMAITMFPLAIAEIERLRAENKIIADRAAHNTKQDAASAKLQAARIKELKGMLSIRTEELDIAHSVARSEKEMHEKELAAFARRIKDLEDALVDERAGVITSHPLTHVIDEDRTEASMQLQAEGKIGPDAKTGNKGNHIVEHDQMIPNGKCWQITEERKAAIWHAVAVLKENDPDDEHLWDEEIAVLRAMLEAAGQ